MKIKTINKTSDHIKAVKQKLDASSFSFKSMKVLFFSWALVLSIVVTVLLTIVLSVFKNVPYPVELHNLIIRRNAGPAARSGLPLLLSYYPWPLLTRVIMMVLLYTVYKAAAGKMHFSGFMKRICRLWLAGFGFLLFVTTFEAPPYFDAGTIEGGIIRSLLLLIVTPQTSMGLYQLQFFCLFYSIMLIATALLTRLRLPLIIGLIYGLIGIFFQGITAMFWYIVPAVVFYNILFVLPLPLIGIESGFRMHLLKEKEKRYGDL